MAQVRIKGTAGYFKLGSVDFSADCTSIVLKQEDAADDVVTFADAATAGGKQFFFEVTAVQDLGAASLHQYVWAQAGNTVTYDFGPMGNATASVSQPHWTGSLVVPASGDIGGEAKRTPGAAFTFDVRFDATATPTKATS
jgi:hypothetical protein